MSIMDILNRMTPEEQKLEGIGALWDAIDEALDCQEVRLPHWLRKELEHAQTKATIAFPHLRSALREKKRAGL
jgi:hypothetical protein